VILERFYSVWAFDDAYCLLKRSPILASTTLMRLARAEGFFREAERRRILALDYPGEPLEAAFLRIHWHWDSYR
jgi:hypothetical protein